MSVFCPRCRLVLEPQGALCPEHGLHGVSADALERVDGAPLLGYTLDGRFALTDYLGGGGMGAVYQGRQLALDRVVAIKVMHASLTATREDRKRFEEEARALSMLASPNAVTLYDYGLVRDGPLAQMAYMVLEFVEGETLAHRMRHGPSTPETIVGILHGVADALDEAHAHGIVHRDLKPANIIMSHDHRGMPLVKVIDFGVASFGGRTGLTRTGFSVGTPSYMAPEQFDADGSAGLDGRADVYAMGVLTFALLTGSKPFHSNSVLELARMHRSSPPPGVPGADEDARLAAFEVVLHRALAKKPADRYATMGAFAHAFQQASVEELPPPTLVARVTRAVPVVVGVPELPVPTPTESFVGMLDAPAQPARRRGTWWALGATVVICGTLGALLAQRLGPSGVQQPKAELPPVVEQVDAPPHVVAAAQTQAAPPGGVPTLAAQGDAEGAALADTDEPAAPISAAPISAAPISAAPISAAPISAAPISAAPISAAPATLAPAQAAPATLAPAQAAPKSTPPAVAARRPQPPRTPVRDAPRMDPSVSAIAGQLDTALGRCGCRAARALLQELRALDGGIGVARRYDRRVAACVVPDVDEACRDGRVVSP